jgi:ribosomal-protein-alanine N-acetyltransferase
MSRLAIRHDGRPEDLVSSLAMEFEILTERLRLRPLRPDDLEALAAVYQHPLVSHWIGESTRESVEREIERQIGYQTSLGYSFWAVEARESGRMVGDCGLQPLEHRGPEVELGYDLHPDVWGRGLATEAARATLRTAFGPMQLDRVIAVVKPEHLASQRVLVKAGLRRTGQREAYEMSMLVYEADRDARDPAHTEGCTQRENHLA